MSPVRLPRQANCAAPRAFGNLRPVASLAPQPFPWRFRYWSRCAARRSRGGAVVVWLAGACYCHSYQILAEGWVGPWSGSLTWSAIAVVPWFALFEWSKQPRRLTQMQGRALLLGLVLGIAALSIALEYLVNFCAGSVTDHLGLLMMRRLPAVGATILLIALARNAVLHRQPDPRMQPLAQIATGYRMGRGSRQLCRTSCERPRDDAPNDDGPRRRPAGMPRLRSYPSPIPGQPDLHCRGARLQRSVKERRRASRSAKRSRSTSASTGASTATVNPA